MASEIALSIVVPFFRKLADFRKTIDVNAPFFAGDDREVVITMDENSEEEGVLELVRKRPRIHWRVLVNDREHGWRNPGRPINVGIRNACGRCVFVHSPESVYVGDAPGIALRAMHEHPGTFVVGQVVFATYDHLARYQGDAAQTFDESQSRFLVPSFFGSFVAERADVEAVRGYAENLEKWGGDEFHLRRRLMLKGIRFMPWGPLKIVHLGEKPRMPNAINEQVLEGFKHAIAKSGTTDVEAAIPKQTLSEQYKLALSLTDPVVNDATWGTDFGRVAFDWR